MMNEMDLYRRVIDGCDEALKEAFIRRMNIADKIASSKLENGQPITTRQIDEMHIQRVAYDVPVELQPMALSLWRSLARMNRGRQYAYFYKNSDNLSLCFDHVITDVYKLDKVLCTSEIVNDVHRLFKADTVTVGDQIDVVNKIDSGDYSFGVVRTNGFYDTSWLYSLIIEKNVYINRFEILEDGSMLVLLSDKIILNDEKKIITVAFSITMDLPGDMAQKVSVFAEAGLNIEYLAVKTQNIIDDDRRNINIVFTELSGAGLNDFNIRSAFLQLQNECVVFKVLGYRNSVL
jgi:chorismate mutase